MNRSSKEQKLHRVTSGDRRTILLAASANRRSRKWQEAKLDAAFGPHTCQHCRAEPCGSMWPHGACCHKCTHLPMPRWRLTHVLWYRKKPFYVMEVPVRRPGAPTETESAELEIDAQRPSPEGEQLWGVQRTDKLAAGGFKVQGSGSGAPRGAASPAPASSVLTDAVYYRWDGVSFWTRRARTHYFLGVRVSPAEFMRALPNAEELTEFAPSGIEASASEGNGGLAGTESRASAVGGVPGAFRGEGVRTTGRRPFRPPHPFEEGITERPADEVGEPIADRVAEPPALPPDDRRSYKKGLSFVELEQAEADRAAEEREDG